MQSTHTSNEVSDARRSEGRTARLLPEDVALKRPYRPRQYWLQNKT
jgi:hypothetical protein